MDLQVKIPGPAARSDGGKRKEGSAGCWISRSKRAGRARVKCRAHRPEPRRGPPGPPGGKGSAPCRREKRLSVDAPQSVPQTDTGGLVEETEVRGRNHVKELGNLAS